MGTPSPASAKGEGTASLDKALDVLDAVGRAPAGLSQAVLAAQLGLPRTTMYRLLGTLVARGMLRRDPLRRVYCLGMRCFEYARAAYSMPDLVAAAGSELRALRDMTGETTYLATLDGLETVSLERCDGAHSHRSSSALGMRKPLHCTSQGKAMLSAMPGERREQLVRELTLTAVTPHTLTDRRRLNAELALSANRGWAIDDEEIVPGVRCCGAPIVDSHGQVRGAISVAGPSFRLSMERLELIGPEVAEAARRIGAQLVVHAPPTSVGEVQVVPGDWAFEGICPVWHAGGGGSLMWADRLGPAIHRADAGSARGEPAADRIVCTLEAPVQALLPHAEGAAALAGDQWWLVRPDGRVQRLTEMPKRRPSAVCVAPDGRAWACMPDGDRWRIGPLGGDARSAPVWRLAEPASAMSWDVTGQQLALAAAGSGTVFVATPGLTALRRLTTVPKGSGVLAGIAHDAEGGLWCALRDGWNVVRLGPDGSWDRVVALPVPCPTGLGFGGPARDRLYVTSARDAVNREALDAAPLSGRLFRLDEGCRGVVMTPMAETALA
jgi:DNA-binding IclR family transcriptional regulator/sugar lactone lactonase YvrE